MQSEDGIITIISPGNEDTYFQLLCPPIASNKPLQESLSSMAGHLQCRTHIGTFTSYQQDKEIKI